MSLHHTCSNILCCNPNHLIEVDRSTHAHIHHGYGCRKHGFENWVQGKRQWFCRICSREWKIRKRSDPAYRERENELQRQRIARKKLGREGDV